MAEAFVRCWWKDEMDNPQNGGSKDSHLTTQQIWGFHRISQDFTNEWCIIMFLSPKFGLMQVMNHASHQWGKFPEKPVDLGYHSFTDTSKLLVVSVESNSTLFLFLISDGDYSKKGIMILDTHDTGKICTRLCWLVLLSLLLLLFLLNHIISYYILSLSSLLLSLLSLLIPPAPQLIT
jgi:hypothetical protein